ncbi:MAG TPA: TRAP transporter small permease [Desulfobacteraceae bacterium]|nr:TRAP transporter small permease [Desulfobacteraceae bacterium]
MMSRLKSLYEKTIFLGMAVACVMILFMAATVSMDVFSRNLGFGSLPWVVEVSEYLLFLTTFLAAPWVLSVGGHVRVDLVIDNLPRKAEPVVQAVADTIGLAVCLFLLYYGTRTALEALRLKTMIFKQLTIPEWWLFCFIPINGLLLTVGFLFRVLGLGRGKTETGEPAVTAKDGP